MKAFIHDYNKLLVKRQIKSFFENDALKFEQDRWRARPEAIYDFTATRKILERGLVFLDNRSHIHTLDMGCGTGIWGREVSDLRLEPEYLGIDFSTNMLIKAREGDKKISKVANRDYILADVEELPLHGKKYDLVLCIHLLEYLINPLEFLKQTRQVLSEKGVVIIVTKNSRAVLWRVVKKLSEVVQPNPLPFQRYFRAGELKHMVVSAGLEPLDWGGVILRPPTYIGDVNDAITLGLPRRLSKLLCSVVFPLETKFSRVTWLREICFWHLYILCKKGQKVDARGQDQ